MSIGNLLSVPDREAAALSCMLQCSEAREASRDIPPEAFADMSARSILLAIQGLHAAGSSVSGLLVLDYIAERASVNEAAALAPIVSDLDELVVVPAAEYPLHIARLRAAYGLREIRTTCIRASEKALDPGARVADLATFVEQRVADARSRAGAGHHGLVGVSIADHATITIPPPEIMIDPILETQHLALIYGERGVGKTWLNLALSCGAATARTIFGRWKIPKPRTVVYIDGEMGWHSVKGRALAMLGGIGCETPEEGRRLYILADQLQEHGVPSLLESAGQARIDAYLDDVGAELVIVDNLSALAGGRDENDAQALQPILDWARRQKRKARSVIFVHHSGKDASRGGRGSSRLEDAPDLIIQVERPKGWKQSDGAIFNVVIRKGRHLHGEASETIEVRIDVDAAGRAVSSVSAPGNLRDIRIMELREKGLGYAEIADDVGCSKATVSRVVNSQ